MADQKPLSRNSLHSNVSFISPRPLSSPQLRTKSLIATLYIPSSEQGPKCTAHLSESQSPSSTTPASDSPSMCAPVANSWNLVPYDVPWGSDYYEYKEGTLPGPEGDCLFLRSPTPVEKRRTSQACKMCRERKAKCTGTHPACGRCLARGLLCEYVPEVKRVHKTTKAASQPRLRDTRSFSHPYARRDSDAYSMASSLESSGSSSPSSYTFSPKREEQDLDVSFPPPNLLYNYGDMCGSPGDDYWSTDSPAYLSVPPSQPQTPYQEQGQSRPLYQEQIQHTYQEDSRLCDQDAVRHPQQSGTYIEALSSSSLQLWNGEPLPSHIHAPVPALHAPRPLHYSQSLPFLPPRKICVVDAVIRPRSAEPEVPMAVDPSVLSYIPPTHSQPAADCYSATAGCVEPAPAFVPVPMPVPIAQVQPWTMDDIPYYLAPTPETHAFMQQYCDVSAYVEENLYENPAAAQFGDVSQIASTYLSPAGDPYGYPSFGTAAASFV